MTSKDTNHAVAVQRFWDTFKAYMEKEQGTESNRFRDRVIPGEVDRLLSPLLQALKTEIRGLHYSIRTEKVYLKHCLSYATRLPPICLKQVATFVPCRNCQAMPMFPRP